MAQPAGENSSNSQRSWSLNPRRLFDFTSGGGVDSPRLLAASSFHRAFDGHGFSTIQSDSGCGDVTPKNFTGAS